MVAQVTTHYSFVKPDLSGSPTTWGQSLNADLDSIDALIYGNQQGVSPIGSITMFAGAAAPANWLICDGSAVSATTYAALYAIVGLAYTPGGALIGGNFNLPNLSQKFPLGASGGTLAATGGEAAHTLTAAELAPHAHPITDVSHSHGGSQGSHSHNVYQDAHSHSAYQDSHNHSYTQPTNYAGYTGQYPSTASVGSTTGTTSTAQPAVHIDSQQPAVHADTQQPAVYISPQNTGLTTTQNAGGGGAHNNMPPYLAINFIIRYQ